MMLILLLSPLSWYRYDFKSGNSFIYFCKISLYINSLSKPNSNMYPNLNSVISLNQLVIKLQLCSSNNLFSLPLQQINDTFTMLRRCVFFKHYIVRAICQFNKFQKFCMMPNHGRANIMLWTQFFILLHLRKGSPEENLLIFP